MTMYTGKLCLAPMVRSGELPMRIMALQYGADLVWSPEIIDRKIRLCTRVENPKLGTIDFVDSTRPGPKAPVIFRTKRSLEKGKLIFQLGSADPEIAVEGALKVVKDVDGIDLNCGCPKPFSVHGGMGAALLSTPELLTLILRNLVEKVGQPFEKPISAKIRLMDALDSQPTLDLVEKICNTGISNLTVHCRTREMRNREEPIRKFVSAIYSVTKKHNVSLIINGAFRCKKEFEQFRKELGITEIGGMIAEAAESNPTVFSDTPKPWKLVATEFIDTCISIDNHPSNTKFILLNQVPGKSEFYKKFSKTKSNDEMKKISNHFEDDGGKIHIRVMQKDKLYDSDQLQFEDKKRAFDDEGAVLKKAKLDSQLDETDKLLEKTNAVANGKSDQGQMEAKARDGKIESGIKTADIKVS